MRRWSEIISKEVNEINSLVMHQIGPLVFYSFKKFEELKILNGFFTRHGGFSKPPFKSLNCAYRTEDPFAPINRKFALEALGLAELPTFYASVAHKTEIVFISHSTNINFKSYPVILKNVDGLVTDMEGIGLMLSVADCIPLFITDINRIIVGLLHVGWRGVHLKFPQIAVKKITKKFNIPPENLIFGIGPCIRKDSYLVENPQQLNDPDWENFIEPVKNNIYKVDIVSPTIKQLTDSGVLKQNIIDSMICTYENNHMFFSCKKEGYISGRFLTFIAK